METLGALSDALHHASSMVGEEGGGSKGPPTFTTVVVIGLAGAGKSATVNNLLGHLVVPTAEDGTTRLPIMINVSKSAQGSRSVWGQIANKPPLMSSDEIKRQIQSEMGRWLPNLGKQRGEISVTYHSGVAPPLRFIDLPGLENKGDAFAAEFGRSNDSTLLIVLSAKETPNAAGARGVRLAQEMDPQGQRAVGVIVKVDQARDDDRALTAVSWLASGRGPGWTGSIPWVVLVGQPAKMPGVVAMSSVEADGGWRGEVDTLRSLLKVPRGEEHKCMGRMALHNILGTRIRDRLKHRVPTVMAALNGRTMNVEEEVTSIGEEALLNGNPRLLALELCRSLDDRFHHQINGEVGGARIVQMFEGLLPNRFSKLPLDDIFSFANVQKVIIEADGYHPFVVSPEKGLRMLIRTSIELAKAPAVQCVDEVHRIMVEAVSAAAEDTPALGRYRPFRKELVMVGAEALEEFRIKAKEMVAALIDMERSFIPPSYFGKLVARRQEMLRREDDIRMEKQRKEEESKALRMAQAKDAEKKLMDKAAPAPTETAQRSPSPTGPQEMLAGWLWKKSNKGDSWSRRWFVLNEKAAKLGYMKKPEDRAFRGTVSLEECVIEENDDGSSDGSMGKSNPMRPPSGAPPLPSNSNTALVFKIKGKSTKSVVKSHAAMTLRADSANDKSEWVNRMRALTAAVAKGADTPKAESKPMTPSAAAASEPPSRKQTILERMGFGKDGGFKTSENLERPPRNTDEDLRVMAQEVKDYVEAVLQQLSANIPKAVIYYQVERAKEAMLAKLYGAVSSRSDLKLMDLLVEDQEVKMQREGRKAQAQMLTDLKRQLSMHEANVTEAEAAEAMAASADDWRVAFHEADPDTGSARSNAGSTYPRRNSSDGDIQNAAHRSAPHANGGSPGAPSVRNPSRVPPPPPGGRGY